MANPSNIKYIMKRIWLAAALLGAISLHAQKQKGFSLAEKPAEKKIEVRYDGRLLTAYRYDDSIRKPFLYPVNTVDGITVTRGYPLEARTGDPTDHPHHVGVWMNYESVNGLDFWNNSTAIPPARRNTYGTIYHQALVDHKAQQNEARLTVTADWKRPDGHTILKEKTTYIFTVHRGDFFIERASTLTAQEDSVKFKDVKDGFFAIRVTHELQQPSKEDGEYIDAQGNITKVPAGNDHIPTGQYTSSEGLTGDAVWSTQARWVMLQGKKEGRNITIGMFDQPGNIGYPAYWHARGYGLFAVNPLGREIFSKGKEKLNFSLAPQQSVTFRYKLVIRSGKPMTPAEMNAIADGFSR